MDEYGFSIKFEQSNIPLKILPKNTWVKVEGLSVPCRVLEISMQSITLDIADHPDISHLQAGKNILLHFLGGTGENTLEITVTIFHVEDGKCICQIPVYVNNEQILVDKIILEIQKNEISEKNIASAIRHKNQGNNSIQNFCPIQSDADMASILNNLVAMLPEETKDSEEEKVSANSLNAIPKSAHEYHELFDPVKAFETLSDTCCETEDYDIEEDDEFIEDLEEDFDLPSVDPLALLRYSIVHKFLLDNLEDPYPDDTKKLEESHISPENVYKKRKISKDKKKNQSSSQGIEHFIPANLLSKMQDPDFLEKIRTGEYDYHLGNKTGSPDKDAAFEEYYEHLDNLPPELVLELMKKKKKQKKYAGLNPKYLTDEYQYSVRDEEDCECVDGDENCFMGKFNKLLENKRTIEFSIKNDPNAVPKSKEQEETAQNKKEQEEKTINLNFNIDI